MLTLCVRECRHTTCSRFPDVKGVGANQCRVRAQVEVARGFIAEQDAAAGKDITVVAGDWLLPGVLEEEFDLGYDYTCAPIPHPRTLFSM